MEGSKVGIVSDENFSLGASFTDLLMQMWDSFPATVSLLFSRYFVVFVLISKLLIQYQKNSQLAVMMTQNGIPVIIPKAFRKRKILFQVTCMHRNVEYLRAISII